MGRVTGAEQAALLARGREQAFGLNAWLDRHLDGRAWFNGDAFGWGDCSVYPAVNNADRLGVAPSAVSGLEAWLARMRDRPSARRLADELAEWVQTLLNRPLDTRGTRKRLYKAHRLEWMIAAGGLDIVARGVERDDIRFLGDVR